MKPQKSKLKIFLYIFLIWALYNTATRYFMKGDSTEMMVLEFYNIAWIGYAGFGYLLGVNISSLYGMWKRKQWAVNALYQFFAVNVLITMLVFVLGFINPELIRDAYLISRESRNLNTEAVDWITSPLMMVLSMVLYLGFYGALVYWIRKKKEYFK